MPDTRKSYAFSRKVSYKVRLTKEVIVCFDADEEPDDQTIIHEALNTHMGDVMDVEIEKL